MNRQLVHVGRWMLVKCRGICCSSSGLFFVFVLPTFVSLYAIIFVAYPAVKLLTNNLKDHGRDKTVPFSNITFDIDLHAVPYANIERCEIRNGQLDCPDIRRKGKTELRQIQFVVIRMLRIFDLIAQKHGIDYWLCRGTLLGAARHNGIIPWDTDTDVAMSRKDYKKFVEKGLKDLPSDIFFQTRDTDKHFEFPEGSALAAKLRDKSSCSKMCLEHSEKCSYEDGAILDVFALGQNSKGNFQEREPPGGLHGMLRSFLYGSDAMEHKEIFPLKKLKYEGFALPVPNQWEKHLEIWYGPHKEYMQMPPKELRRPPGNIVPDPFHSCEDLKKKEKRLKNRTAL